MAYDRNFYETRHRNTYSSAKKVLEFLRTIVRFESIVDFGCGAGTWLSVGKELGAKKVLGLDGSWVPQDCLQVGANEFKSFDFERDSLENQSFDVSISLEVAEHLDQSVASKFVDLLCTSSDVVLFGAAIPLQGGNNHVNEQWPAYWIELFAKRNFEVLDVIRPHFWDDAMLPFWYKQNPLLFVKKGSNKVNRELLFSLPSFFGQSIVHPDLYQIRANPSLIERCKLVASSPRYLYRRLFQV